MIVYRITLAIHADRLAASGNPARWNSKDVKVIYASSSRSLACLENVVHRNSRGLNNKFRTILIDIPSSIKIERLDSKTLIPGWQKFQNMSYTQKVGDKWIETSKSAVLAIPSVIVPGEYNYLLNPNHKDFTKIKYKSSEHFEFDPRLKD